MGRKTDTRLVYHHYDVMLNLTLVAAGLPSIRPQLDYAVKRGQPSEREFRARQRMGEPMPPHETMLEAVHQLQDVVQNQAEPVGPAFEGPARFRICKEHGVLYVPNGFVRSMLTEPCRQTVKLTGIGPATFVLNAQIYPQIIHLQAPDGRLWTKADTKTTKLYGTVDPQFMPRSIEQECEVVGPVVVNFQLFISTKIPGRAMADLRTVEDWFEHAQGRNILTAHRRMERSGILTDFNVEEMEVYKGTPFTAGNWEMEDYLKIWMGEEDEFSSE